MSTPIQRLRGELDALSAMSAAVSGRARAAKEYQCASHLTAYSQSLAWYSRSLGQLDLLTEPQEQPEEGDAPEQPPLPF